MPITYLDEETPRAGIKYLDEQPPAGKIKYLDEAAPVEPALPELPKPVMSNSTPRDSRADLDQALRPKPQPVELVKGYEEEIDFQPLGMGAPIQPVPDLSVPENVQRPSDFLPMEPGSGFRVVDSSIPAAGLADAERDLQLQQKGWENLTSAEKEEVRQGKVAGIAPGMKGQPAASAITGVMGKLASAAGTVALDKLVGEDREPAFFEAAQQAAARGLARGDTFKQRFFGETLPRLATDTPLYIGSALLTKGFGTFSTMNLLEQTADKINLNKEFSGDELKMALLTDALFKAMPALGVGFKATGGAPQAVAAELGNIGLTAGVFTGLNAVQQWANNEELKWGEMPEAYLENLLTIAVLHGGKLLKAAKTPKPDLVRFKGQRSSAAEVREFYESQAKEIKAMLKKAKAGDIGAQAWIRNKIVEGAMVAEGINPTAQQRSQPTAQRSAQPTANSQPPVTTPESRPVVVRTAGVAPAMPEVQGRTAGVPPAMPEVQGRTAGVPPALPAGSETEFRSTAGVPIERLSAPYPQVVRAAGVPPAIQQGQPTADSGKDGPTPNLIAQEMIERDTKPESRDAYLKYEQIGKLIEPDVPLRYQQEIGKLYVAMKKGYFGQTDFEKSVSRMRKDLGMDTAGETPAVQQGQPENNLDEGAAAPIVATGEENGQGTESPVGPGDLRNEQAQPNGGGGDAAAKAKKPRTPKQQAAWEANRAKAQPVDELLADFRKQYPHIRRPRPGDTERGIPRDPLYAEYLGKKGEPGAVPAHRFRRKPLNPDQVLLYPDQIAQLARTQLPHLVTEEMDDVEVLRAVYSGRLETVGSMERSKDAFIDNQAAEYMYAAMLDEIKSGYLPSYAEQEEFPDVFGRALADAGVKAESLKPVDMPDDVMEELAAFAAQFEEAMERGEIDPAGDMMVAEAGGTPAVQPEAIDGWEGSGLQDLLRQRDAALRNNDTPLVEMLDKQIRAALDQQFDEPKPQTLEEWQAAHGMAPGPEQAEMFGKGAVGDAFELRPETVKGKETFSERKAREAKAAEAERNQGAMFETAGASKGGDGSGGLGAAGVPSDDPNYSALPMEMPELVELAELLGAGKLPKIKTKLGKAIGLFRFQPGDPNSGSIELKADIFELVAPEERQELRKQAMEYARRMKELDPTINETDVWRARYEELYGLARAERMKQDPVLARKTIAHEIGHWIDFLPDAIIKRGNILGHIAALKGYTKSMLEEKPGSGGLLTDKDRAQLRRQAEKDLKALRGEVKEIVEEITREVPIYATTPVTADDVKSLMGLNAREATPELYEWFARQERAVKKDILKQAMQGVVDARAKQFDTKTQVGTETITETIRRTEGGKPITKQEIQELYRKLLKEEVARRRLHELEAIKAELEGAIAWWNGTDKMPEYYRTGEEMFADAFSIFLNNPAAMAQRAPKFFKAIHDHMEARPEAMGLYRKLQEDIRSGAIHRNRVKRLHKAFDDEGASLFDQREAGQNKTRREKLDHYKYTFDAVFGPVETRLRNSSMSNDERGQVMHAIENYLYRATGHEYYMGRMNREVVRPLLDNELVWQNLSEYMFHQRVMNERGDKANPLGWTTKSSGERLAEMKSELGPARFAALEQAHQALWGVRQTTIDMLEQSGYVTPELLELIKDNMYYATFNVNRDGSTGQPGTIEEMLNNTYGSNVGPKIYRQVGTLKRIVDPAAATVMKDLSLQDAARRNVAKAEVVDMLRNEFPKEIKQAQTRWNGQYNEIVVREGERAGTIIVMRNGKPEGWYVPKVFVEAFERGNTIENQVMLNLLSTPSRVIKNAYTQLNPGFWPVAFVRDAFAYFGKMPRRNSMPFGGPQFWKYVRQAMQDSASSVFGSPNAGALESLQKQDWITVANPMGFRGDDIAADKLLKRYWQDTTKAPGDIKMMDRVLAAWQKYLDMGQVFERTVKRVGRMYLEDNFADMPEWRKQFNIHNLSGSPNFLRKGAGNPKIDLVAMFYNPCKESLRSLGLAAVESPAAMAWNIAKFSTTPKVLMWLFASGAVTALMKSIGNEKAEKIAADIEEMYSYISDYDKANYTVIPLGWVDYEKRKVACFRLPMAEEFRIPGAITWKLLNRDAGTPQDLLNYMGGQVPAGNPMWEVPSAWLQYVSGRNPYDWFRGRPLLDDDVAEAGGAAGLEAMGKYTWNTLGGSMIHRFEVNDYGEEKTDLEEFLQLPVVSNIIGRWVKVTNRGRADYLRQKVVGPLRKEQAQSRLDAREALYSGDMGQMQSTAQGDPRAAKYMMNNAARLYMRNEMKPEDAMLMFAPTTEEKLKLGQFMYDANAK